MIKLSDYLDYLNNEIIQARKRADENAVKIAKEYANHEYLKYFKVPRFSMPSVKMDIPLKITDIDSNTKFEFKLNDNEFIEEVNSRIEKVKKEKTIVLPKLNKSDLNTIDYNNLVKKIDNSDFKFNDNLLKRDINKLLLGRNRIRPLDTKNDEAQREMQHIFTDVIMMHRKPIASKINNLFIDPDTTKSLDKDKIMVNLSVEMVEESIRIVKLTDAHGKEIEEIIFD